MGTTISTPKYITGKLISIENNQLVLSPLLDHANIDTKQTFIISMLGCARVGKSTFINMFLSYLFNENIQLVETSFKSTHCTMGIDYIIYDCPRTNIQIMILDCQGLNYTDSKNDDKLLSFIYAISNIIIYHDANIINNQTLNTLTSLCAITSAKHLRTDKPTLYFRMRDFNLESSMDDIIEQTFAKQDDQYENVRNSIKKLFPNIHGIFTETLGKHELKKIKEHDYLSICNENDDYNFKRSIEQILCDIDIKQCVLGSLVLQNIHSTIEQINCNLEVTYKNYDYLTLINKEQFREYWMDVEEPYTSIIATKYESTIDSIAKALIKIESINESFRQQFLNNDDNLIQKELETFNEPHFEYLNRVKQNSEALAKIFINEYNSKICKKITQCIQKDQKMYYSENCCENKIDPTKARKPKIIIPSKFLKFITVGISKNDFSEETEDLINDEYFDESLIEPDTICNIVYDYIRNNKLFKINKNGSYDKRTIVPNEALATLLSIKSNKALNFYAFRLILLKLTKNNNNDTKYDEINETDEINEIGEIECEFKYDEDNKDTKLPYILPWSQENVLFIYTRYITEHNERPLNDNARNTYIQTIVKNINEKLNTCQLSNDQEIQKLLNWKQCVHNKLYELTSHMDDFITMYDNTYGTKINSFYEFIGLHIESIENPPHIFKECIIYYYETFIIEKKKVIITCDTLFNSEGKYLECHDKLKQIKERSLDDIIFSDDYKPELSDDHIDILTWLFHKFCYKMKENMESFDNDQPFLCIAESMIHVDNNDEDNGYISNIDRSMSVLTDRIYPTKYATIEIICINDDIYNNIFTQYNMEINTYSQSKFWIVQQDNFNTFITEMCDKMDFGQEFFDNFINCEHVKKVNCNEYKINDDSPEGKYFLDFWSKMLIVEKYKK